MILTDLLFGNLLILLSGGLLCPGYYSLQVRNRQGRSKKDNTASFLCWGDICFVRNGIISCAVRSRLDAASNMAVLGLFCTGMATFLFLTALKIIDTTRTALLYSTNFAFGFFFAMPFLHESITMINLASIVFASAGIYLSRNRLGSIEEQINPIEEQSKKDSFKTLWASCQHHGCCTSFATPVLFPTDVDKLKDIGKAGKEHITETTNQDKKVKILKKKENSTQCVFCDESQKKC